MGPDFTQPDGTVDPDFGGETACAHGAGASSRKKDYRY